MITDIIVISGVNTKLVQPYLTVYHLCFLVPLLICPTNICLALDFFLCKTNFSVLTLPCETLGSLQTFGWRLNSRSQCVNVICKEMFCNDSRTRDIYISFRIGLVIIVLLWTLSHVDQTNVFVIEGLLVIYVSRADTCTSLPFIRPTLWITTQFFLAITGGYCRKLCFINAVIFAVPISLQAENLYLITEQIKGRR